MAKLISALGRPIKVTLAAAGFHVSRQIREQPSRPQLTDQPQWIRDIIERVAPFTMTSHERLAAVCQSIAYIVRNKVVGDIVECGVWKGGSMMAAALALSHFNDNDRTLLLFDTFEGMSEPTEHDLERTSEIDAKTLLQSHNKDDLLWAVSPLDEVRRNIDSVKYKGEVVFVKGKVENTIPFPFKKPIALLRLDTDWYESTRHELNELYPRLSKLGVLIIDDYGHWDGARKAVDEYIEENNLPLFLNRIDYTGRLAIKAF